MRDYIKPTIRTLLMVLPLLAGEWIYANGRKGNTLFESWIGLQKHAGTLIWQSWLPDYLWCVSLLAALVFIWKGWSKIPFYWKTAIWVIVCSSEIFQYMHLLPGTGDMNDMISYQAAFVSMYLLHKTNVI